MADGDYFHSLSEQLPRTYLIPKARALSPDGVVHW